MRQFVGVGGIDMNLRHREGEVLPVVVAIYQHLGVGGYQGGLFLKFLFEEMDGFVDGAVKQPAHHAKGKHIARFEYRFLVKTGIAQRLFGQLRQRNGHDLHRFGNAQFGERVVRLVECFFQIFGGERIGIYDDHGVPTIERVCLVVACVGVAEFRPQRADLECRCVHSHQHIGFVAGSENSVSYIHLKTGYATESTLRGAYLRRKIGEGRNLIAEDGAERGEHIPRQLHAIARVAAEAYNDILLFHTIFFCVFTACLWI